LPATAGFSGLAPLLIASLAVLAVGLTVGYHLFLGRAGGRSAAAIRQAPETAQACGIGLVAARWRPFVGNAAATGLAGALYAHLVGSVEPVVVFAPILSALPLILGMLGGPLNPLGGLAGTLALYPIDELLLRPALPQAHALAYGVALVGLLVLRPGGLLGARIPAVPAGARVVVRGPLALVAERLRVRLSGATVVEDVTFAVPPGQILGVTGPNGAGKSSLLLALAGALPPARGLVRLNGAAAPRGVAARARLGVARTFQAPQPFPDWTVRENVAIAAEHGGAPGEVPAILDAVQLTPLQDRRAGQLSVGEAKRLELARALALKPAVLLLDEPLAGLSPDGAGAVVRVIARVRDGGAAVVWVEHGFAWGELAGQLLVLEEGRVRFHGTPRDWEARRRSLPA
jgi:ABC-type branched-subunit amino acid transport system ATPase component